MGIRASAQRFFHMATTSTPPAGQLALFAKSDDSLWTKRSDGTERSLGGGDTGWVSYIPTAQGASTAFTSYTVSGKYRRSGNTVNFTVEVNVTNVGGASGQAVLISLPYQIASGLRYIAAGRENAVTGNMLQGILNPGATNMTVFTYSNSGMAATNHQYILSGTYEAVPL